MRARLNLNSAFAETMTTSLVTFFNRHQGHLALACWFLIALFLLHHPPLPLDEGAAKAMLFSWSIADQVANSVITFGTPDLRILPLLPIGFLWTGSIIAVKVALLLVAALTAYVLYQLRREVAGHEAALISVGLLLISPALIEDIDKLAPGTFLIAAFVLGTWIHRKHPTSIQSFNGWYFTQLLLCAFSVSLHPAGLAYPLSLIIAHHRTPSERKQPNLFLAGIIFSSLAVLVLRFGWSDLSWLQNPLLSLSSLLPASANAGDDQPGAIEWLVGCFFALLLLFTVFLQRKNLTQDFLGQTLLFAALFGSVSSDIAWPLISLTIILIYGLPLLLRPNPSPSEASFFKQRGIALLCVFLCSLVFMQFDKSHWTRMQDGALSPEDQLIRSFAEIAQSWKQASESDESNKPMQRLIVASQWPSRTMIACKCDTLPLPPAASNPQEQLSKLKGVSHLLLNPKLTSNIELARNLSLLGGAIETVSLQPGGVLLQVKNQ